MSSIVFFVFNKLRKGSPNLAKWKMAFERPLRLFFVLLGLYLPVSYLLPPEGSAMLLVTRLFRSGLILLVGWSLYILSARSSVILEEISKKMNVDDSSMMIPFISKVIRFIIVVLTVTLVGAEWGFSINGVVAGMGLGSVAIAFAAKDSLSHIFGGIVIITEKPFSKGDWILTPSVEGFVEDITFRSTRIRTFADAVVTMPNATLANEPITNWSRMGKRRITFSLNVALDSDPNRLATAIARCERMLREHDSIDQQTLLVKFNEFNASSLGIFFYFFTRTTVWAEHLSIRQEINLMLLQILEEEGVKLAYPTHRVLYEEDESEVRQFA
ncbi:mechanosensitive ion channel family protein [Paenibacillus sp. M1]|uniref:Mechanosensitive ion channel family protein n=1 Tax=Paenibacillus haidiansis TaxID=1574488 RepID=A0ABU7VMP1_9BACL